MARPMPCCAPVTSATFPFSRILVLGVARYRCRRADYRARGCGRRAAAGEGLDDAPVGQELIAGRNVSTSIQRGRALNVKPDRRLRDLRGPASRLPCLLCGEGTLSHFSREPKVVSHFSHPPEAVRAPPSTTPTVVTPPSGEVSPSARRFGEILVEEQIITEAQLEAALRLQAVSQTYVPIRQCLLPNH